MHPADPERLPRGWGPWGDPDWFDRPRKPSAPLRLLVPVVLSFLVQVPNAVMLLVILPAGPGPLIGVVASVLGALGLLGARRFPGPTVAVVALLGAVDFVVDTPVAGAPFVALAFAIGGAIVRGARVWAWSSVATAWAATLVYGVVSGTSWHPGRIAGTTLAILVVFGVAESIRTRREHLAEFRRRVAHRRQSEVLAERARIARELHDVLAHSLSQISVQAGVGLHLMDTQPQQAKDALTDIKATSKSALDEVRSLLGVLRAGGDADPSAPLVPEPDLGRLPGLVASVTTQGVAVTLSGEIPDAPKAVQLALYRIAQESLTNVVRHAHATRASVELGVDAGGYLVRVADDGRGLDPVAPSGRGLLGMRERAELLGGSLSTGRSDLGGTLVTARIPRKEPA